MLLFRRARIALVLLMVAVISATVMPRATGVYSGLLVYKLSEDGKSYYVKDCPDYAVGALIIPNTYNGLPVTAIGGWAFDDCNGITSVNTGSGIEVIGASAFRGCTGLSSVKIGSSVTEIGDQAFFKCSSLKSIVIPSNVITIGSYVFNGCSSLATISVSDTVESIGRGAFDSTKWYEAMPNGVVYIADIAYVYKGYADAEFDVTVREGTRHINGYAFSGCKRIKSVTLPLSLESIGDYAFYECIGLESIELPSGLASVGKYAFESCDSLKEVTIPAGVAEINPAAFGYTSTSGIFLHTPGFVLKCFDNTAGSQYAIDNMIDYTTVIPSGELLLKTGKFSRKGDLLFADGTEVMLTDILGNLESGYIYVADSSGKAITSRTEPIPTGAAVYAVNSSGKLLDIVILVVPGDVDGNGYISTDDARRVLRVAVGLDTLDRLYTLAAKVTPDSPDTVTTDDARKILRIAVGLDKI